MAIKVEELQVLISANADQFKNELQSINSKLAGLKKVTGDAGGAVQKSLFPSLLKANLAATLVTKAIGGIVTALGYIKTGVAGSIQTTQQFESALIGLETVAGRRLGQQAIPLATQAAKDLASDGLLPVKDAALGLKNLLASGFSLQESIDLMRTFKDSAAFGRQSALTFGQAVSSATEGIKNGNSILVDNAGITKNLSVILKEAGKSQNDLMNATSDASVRQALYNGLMKEGKIFQGDSAKLARTTAGANASLAVTLLNLKNVMGQFIKPIQSVVQSALAAFLAGIGITFSSSEAGIKSFSVRVAGYMLALARLIGSVLMRIPVIGKNFAGLANLSLSTAKAQDKLGATTNSYAEKADKAASNTKKLKKELAGLASFDELNVLKTPDKGVGAGGVTGGGGAVNPLPDSAGISDFASNVNASANEITARLNALKSNISGILGSIKGLFTPFGDGIRKAWNDFTGGLVSGWSVSSSQIMANFSTFLNNLKLDFISIKTNVIDPIFTPMVEQLKKLWTDNFGEMGSQIGLLGGKIINLGLLVYNNFISPMVKWWSTTLSPVFTAIGAVLGTVVKNVGEGFMQVKNSVFGVLNGIIDFLTGVFSGNWKLAWNGIVTTFKNIFGGITAIGKSIMNTFIDLINDFLTSKLSKIRIPDWVPEYGGRSFSIPKIPRMAQGGVITKPTLIQAGEAGEEAIVPLENSKFLDKLAAKMGTGNISLVVKLGEETIARKLIGLQNDFSMLSGDNVLTI